jgi:hypothetical protein
MASQSNHDQKRGFQFSYKFSSPFFQSTFEHIIQSIRTSIGANAISRMSPDSRKDVEVGDGLVQDEQVWLHNAVGETAFGEEGSGIISLHFSDGHDIIWKMDGRAFDGLVPLSQELRRKPFRAISA